MSIHRPLMSLPAFTLLATLGCSPAEPHTPTTEPLPPAGADGEYSLDWPEMPQGDDRFIGISLVDDAAGCRDVDPHFAFDRDEPRPQDELMLEALARCLNQPELRSYEILLTGHADPRGADGYNDNLAWSRARNVMHELVDLGVDQDRFLVRSSGEQQSVGNAAAYSYGYDRRVEVELRGVVHAP